MSVTYSADPGLYGPSRARMWPAFGAALTLETVAIASLIAWTMLHPKEPVLRPLAIEIAAPTPAVQPEPPAPPKPVVPTPIPLVTSQAKPVKVAASPSPAPSPPPLLPLSAAPSEVAAPATPVPLSAAPAVAPPPPSLPPPAGPVGPSSDYIAKVRAAVQAAFAYPAAAAAADFHGRTRVAFSLRDVTVSGARVLVGSGMGLVDRAALQAVQAARYPAPPADMQGREHTYEVWVEFRP